jgi:glycine dehydrogenase subunit 1
MHYLPHTPADREFMLRAVGAQSIEELFADVPADVRFPHLDLPDPLAEPELLAELRAIAEKNWDADHHPCFLGAGAYNHFIPTVVRHALQRSEFCTAYTPYQPELSQGTLQATFEYQSMICELTGMDVANASHYDGATATAEAVLMAFNVLRGERNRVLLSRYVHPHYRQAVHTYLQGFNLEIAGEERPAEPGELAHMADSRTCCAVVQVPDFRGELAPLGELISLAERLHSVGALLIAVVNPISLGLLKPPGAFGADIVVGEGQPLGNELSFGGPYLGFFATKMEYVRRMPGRLVGMTVDRDGKRAFVLTLATREQHIRREKATSSICTNQAMNALAAAVYMAALGPSGLRHVASLCYDKAHYAATQLAALPGFSVLNRAFFHEFVLSCPMPAEEIAALLLERGIIPGYCIGKDYPEYTGCMLLCCTEMNTRAQIDRLVQTLEELA